MPHVESRLRVRYKETDQMGIAHHANYIVWFEIGRTDLCRATGFPYNEIESRGFILVVTDIQCRYRMPFRYDDEVVIRTSRGGDGQPQHHASRTSCTTRAGRRCTRTGRPRTCGSTRRRGSRCARMRK